MPAISQVILELTRQPAHPLGDRNHAYHLYLPLREDGRIDTDGWPHQQARCRVRRFRPGEGEARGKVVRGSDGRWMLAYDGRFPDDELNVSESEERLLPGECISIRRGNDGTHRFQIIAVRPG